MIDKTSYHRTIVGAGISGASMAYYGALCGMDIKVLEQASVCASKASGNEVSILYPRLDIEITPTMCYYLEAFKHVISKLENMPTLFVQCGLVQLADTPRSLQRLQRVATLVPELAVFSNNLEEYTGMELRHKAGLIIAKAGYVFPKKWCQYLLQHPNITVVYDTKLQEIKQDEKYIFCNSYEIEQFFPQIKLKMIRGQLSFITQTTESSKLRTVVCGSGGYITPAINDVHYLGATYDHHNMSLICNEVSHAQNMALLENFFIDPSKQPMIVGGRACIRSVTKDRVPLCKAMSSSIYCSVGHGSRGMLSGPYAAYQYYQNLA